jgi:hypothetical protein
MNEKDLRNLKAAATAGVVLIGALGLKSKGAKDAARALMVIGALATIGIALSS